MSYWSFLFYTHGCLLVSQRLYRRLLFLSIESFFILFLAVGLVYILSLSPGLVAGYVQHIFLFLSFQCWPSQLGMLGDNNLTADSSHDYLPLCGSRWTMSVCLKMPYTLPMIIVWTMVVCLKMRSTQLSAIPLRVPIFL